MTGPERPARPRPRWDPDATVMLPAVGDTLFPTFSEPTYPFAGNNDATQVLPILDLDQPTQQIPRFRGPPGVGGAHRAKRRSAATDSDNVTRSSGVMALGSLVSRATGFLRTAVIGAAIGGGLVGNAYQIANTLPNMVYELLLGGILSSVIVPLLVAAKTKDPDGGEAFTHRLLTAATLLLAGATVLAMAAAPLLTVFFNDGATTAASRTLTNTLAYLLLPEIFFYGLAALLAAVLNTHNRFGAPMWAPILNNVAVIVTAVVFLMLPGPKTLLPESITGPQVAVLGIGTTVGILCQALALWPALREVGFRWRWRFDLRGSGLGEAGRIGSWMFVYVAVSQLGLLPVLKIANYAGNRGAPGPVILNNSYLLFMMLHGIVAVSILTALLPRMSKAATEKRYAELTESLSLGARLSSVVLVPATVAYLVLGVPLAVTAFYWGQFSYQESVDTGYATVAAAIGLVPFAISQMQLFAFYALRDTKTVALLNIPVMATKVVFDLALMFFLPPGDIVIGLQFGNTLSYVVAVAISSRLLHRRLGSIDSATVLRTLTRLTLASVPAGVAAWAVAAACEAVLGAGKVGSLVALIAGGLALIAVYVVVTLRMRVPEMVELYGTIRQRLPGRT